jgi:hypothetical protein
MKSIRINWYHESEIRMYYPNPTYWFIYRQLADKKTYKRVGRIKWNQNYIYLPIKDKYRTLIYFSAQDNGEYC